MENIQPWCISRQLWWGHQNFQPGTGPTARVFVARPRRKPVGNALGYYAEQEVITPEQGRERRSIAQARGFITRDEDVLDTGFPRRCGRSRRSAGPTTITDVKRYYPDDVSSPALTSSSLGRPHDDDGDSFHAEERLPLRWKESFHSRPSTSTPSFATRRARRCRSRRQRSSTPLHLIDDFGADACASRWPRWRRRAGTSSFQPNRVEGYRNFATKLWNACRFAEMNACELPRDSIRPRQSRR